MNYDIAVITEVPQESPHDEWNWTIERTRWGRLRHRLLHKWWVWDDWMAITDKPMMPIGNLAHGPQVYIDTTEDPFSMPISEQRVHGISAVAGLYLMTPVFQLGEIVFLRQDTGREITGLGRKPDKWMVEYEIVDTIDEAIALSRKVRGYDQEGQ